MSKISILLILGTFFMLSVSCSKRETGKDDLVSKTTDLVGDQVSNYTKDWPSISSKAAKAMIEKYGNPTFSTESMLTWRDVENFKRIIVYKEEINHNFPMPHKDVIEHVVSYRPQGDKVDELFRFDGSIYVDRTRGEMSARCESEPMNILALNLANEVLTGKMSVTDARSELAKRATAYIEGSRGPYTDKILFVRQLSTADPDSMFSARPLKQAEEVAPHEETDLRRDEFLEE